MAIEPGLATAWRNLALGRFNIYSDSEGAREALGRAVSLRPNDARLKFELDQLDRRRAVSPSLRLSALGTSLETVVHRDDLSIEYVTLLNLNQRSDEALEFLLSRKFHVWEGGEGKVLRQYVRSLIGAALARYRESGAALAFQTLLRAEVLPESLGEARLPGARESQLRYFLGTFAQKAGLVEDAWKWWSLAAQGNEAPAGMMFYNDTPPELIFYQGLARKRLGDESGALGRFHALVDFGERHFADEVSIDYFAVSLPDFLLFEEDLVIRHQLHCRFLAGLGYWGLGHRDRAVAAWEEVASRDPSHAGAVDHLAWAKSGSLDL